MADTLKAQHTAHLTQASSAIRTWAGSSARSPPTAAAGTIRCADSPTRRSSPRATARPRSRQHRNAAPRERAGSHAGRARQARPRRARSRRQHQFLQQGAWWMTRARMHLVAGPLPRRAMPSTCASRWTRIVVLHAGPHPLAARARATRRRMCSCRPTAARRSPRTTPAARAARRTRAATSTPNGMSHA